MANDLLTFDNEDFGQINVLTINGEFWFIGREIASSLGYATTQKAIRDHCKYAKLLNCSDLEQLKIEKFDIGPRGITIIPESDVYRLIMRSKLQKAELFQNWIVEDVIPSIRKTGEYSIFNKKSHGKNWEDLPSRDIDPDVMKLQYPSIINEVDLLSKYCDALESGSYKKAKIFEDMYIRKLGHSPIKLLSYPAQKLLFSSYITPQEIGELLNEEMTSREVNRWLLKHKFQKKDIENRRYIPIGDGKDFAADIEYQDEKGIHYTLKWHKSIVKYIQKIIDSEE